MTATTKHDILQQSGILYKSKKYSEDSTKYRVDGLIYTPKKLAVGANFENDAKASVTGSWINTFKWKPPNENTIDFLVRFDKQDGQVLHIFPDNETVMYTSVSLFVGMDGRLSKPVKATQFFEDSVIRNEDYRPVLFLPRGDLEPAYSKYIGNLVCTQDANDTIKDESIIEFSFDADKQVWVPLRTRTDKTKAYKSIGFAKTANDYKQL